MKWSRAALGVAGAGAVAALLAFGMTRDATSIPSPLVGGRAPAFRLETLAGRDTLTLASLRGRVVVVNFWASWCLACRQEHPALLRAYQAYEAAGKPVRMLGIVYQDSRANARRYLDEFGGGWTQLMDPATRTAIDFGVYGVPETYFISKDGRIAHKHVGPVDDELMRQQIDRLLAEQAQAAPR